MTRLERVERGVIIFLVTALITGITISAFRKIRPPITVSVEKFNAERYKAASMESYLSDDVIDLNTADARELEKIKGIGPALASRIVEYRYQNGDFASVDDIKNVRGVGVALFEKIKTKIKVE